MSNSQDITFSSLDPSQKHAFQSIDNDDTRLHIVHGPPGTGKSQLVVSLLERFASEGKKVLFVSQNTEALKVIERMIERTEKTIGYPTDNKYVSLSDFCLMLYNPTHRHLKYLREQYTRLSSKQLPSVNSVTEPSDINYALRYTNLNHEDNYDTKDGVIGFDQLVSYYIKYVNQVMAPEPIRSFQQINVPVIFDALDGYVHKDYFSEFNKPRRELVLLSTENSNLTLPDVRNSLRNIKDVLTGDWIEGFAAKSKLDVSVFIERLRHYEAAIIFLDAYRVSTENKDIQELADSIKSFIDSYESVSAEILAVETNITRLKHELTSEIIGVDHNTTQLKLSASAVEIAGRNLDEVVADRKRILKLSQEITILYPDIKHIGVQDLWVGLVKDVKKNYEAVVLDESGVISKLTAEAINQLNEDIDAYYDQNSVKRMLSGVPNSAKESLVITNAKQLDKYKTESQAAVTVMMNILEFGGETIKDILSTGKKTANIPLSRVGIKSADTIQAAQYALLPVHEFVGLLEKYSIDIKDFESTKEQLQSFSQSISLLEDIINNPDNKKTYISNTLDVFVQAVNITIDIKTNDVKRLDLIDKQKVIQEESFRQNGQYLAGITEASDYTVNSANIYAYLLNNKDNLMAMFSTLDIPSDNCSVSVDLDNVTDVINEAKLTQNFSPYFFTVDEWQTLGVWLSSVTVLEVYNNDAEIVDFVEHNKFITMIRDAFGADNKRYLDDILANDISFELFAARIVNVIVGESFGRAKLSDKKHVTTQSIIESYDAYLKNQKAMTYRENLSYVYSNTIDATKELSKQSTLMLGGKSTMDKFRHNTHTITEAFPIVCATPKDVSKYIASTKGLFDYVIFDEASQLLPGQAIPSIYRAQKAVIIGDPHQMPPGLNASFGGGEQAEDDFDDLGESILDLVLKQPQRQHHLKVHYRSKYNKLFEPSREAIYSNDGIEPIFEAELANGAPIDIIDDLGDNQDELGYDKNFYKICESIDEYIAQNNGADFCVLFTTQQVLSRFKDFLAEVGERQYSKVADLYDKDKILVSTVTNCQGIEGAYTIIYLHHYDRPGSMWFFQETVGAYKRLNVSITRQREGIKLLLADQKSSWIKTCDDKLARGDVGPNVQKSAQLMKALLTNAGEQADETYLDRKLGRNSNWFDSPLTEQLHTKLTDHYADKMGNDLKIYSEVGWNLLIPTGEGIDANERNVGFRIDLGIYSIRQKKFILGIEMDGAMYHSGFDKEHSDYNRQKVLEQKGWELYRIWSTNWLNDGDQELRRLTQKIDEKLSINY
jgi:hypothetical protein